LFLLLYDISAIERKTKKDRTVLSLGKPKKGGKGGTRVEDIAEKAANARFQVAWTRKAFKNIGDDAAPAGGDSVAPLSREETPDVISGNATRLLDADDTPNEAIVGVVVALSLLIIIMLVRYCCCHCADDNSNSK